MFYILVDELHKKCFMIRWNLRDRADAFVVNRISQATAHTGLPACCSDISVGRAGSGGVHRRESVAGILAGCGRKHLPVFGRNSNLISEDCRSIAVLLRRVRFKAACMGLGVAEVAASHIAGKLYGRRCMRISGRKVGIKYNNCFPGGDGGNKCLIFLG